MEEPEIISQGALPEVTPPEILPEDEQPEELIHTKNRYIIEMLMRIEESQKSTDKKMEIINKKMDESSQSNRETNQSIESLKADLSQKIEEGQKDNQKHIELLKEEFYNQISETNRRMEEGLSLIHI